MVMRTLKNLKPIVFIEEENISIVIINIQRSKKKDTKSLLLFEMMRKIIKKNKEINTF